jgi:hypothetical protein
MSLVHRSKFLPALVSVLGLVMKASEQVVVRVLVVPAWDLDLPL